MALVPGEVTERSSWCCAPENHWPVAPPAGHPLSMQLTLVLPPAVPSTEGRAPADVPAGTSLRPILPADIDAVGALYHRCLPADAQCALEDAIADVRGCFEGEYGRLIPAATLLAHRPATEEATVLGAVLTVDAPPWPDVADLVFLIDLFVAPEARRQGIARALTAEAIDATRSELPGRSIGLRVENENTAAVALYRSLGFVELTPRA